MSTGIAAAQTFQEKMFARIKDQMGDLLTGVEMKALVDKAMEEAFFKVRETKDSYGHVRETKPPLFVELVQDEMKQQVKDAVTTWMQVNPEAVTKAIDETIAKGFYELVRQHQQNQIQQGLSDFANYLRTKGLAI